MKKCQFSYRPELVTNEGSGVLICFGVEEVVEICKEYVMPQKEEATDETEVVEGAETPEEPKEPVLVDVEHVMYNAYAVRLQHPVTHSRVVDAIVTAAYPNDVMQAITNNHMLNDGNDNHEAEYEAMQEWRNLAKATADEVLGYNQVKEATYEEEPKKIESRGDGKYVYRWNIAEVVVIEEEPVVEETEPTQEELDNVIVREASDMEEINTEAMSETETPSEESSESETETESDESTEVEESVEEPQPTMWKCKEVLFKMPMSVDALAKIVASDDTEDYEAIRNEVGLAVIPLDIEAAKKELTEKILAYDSSEAVNSFTFGGIPMWLDKATRVGLKLRFEAELALGKESTTLWLNGMNFTLPLSGAQSAINVLVALEVYASASYDVTQMHLANVAQMTTAEEILAYDITSGYPEKLSF